MPASTAPTRTLERERERADIAGAIYGLILTASVIAVASEGKDTAAEVAVTSFVTLVVFWLAHAYSHVLARWTVDRRAPTLDDVRRSLRREWPMVSAGLLPIAVLLLGVLDAVSTNLIANIALALCILELTAVGAYAARHGGARVGAVVVSGLLAATAGGFIVLLKVLIH